MLRLASPTRRLTRREDGQAYVEFAFVLPVLLLIVMGIIQFGMAFKNYIALTDAVRVGARQAAVSRSIDPESNRVPLIVDRVKQSAIGLDPNQINVTVELLAPDGTPTWAPTGDVTVRASYPFRLSIFGMAVVDSTINSRTTERVE